MGPRTHHRDPRLLTRRGTAPRLLAPARHARPSHARLPRSRRGLAAPMTSAYAHNHVERPDTLPHATRPATPPRLPKPHAPPATIPNVDARNDHPQPGLTSRPRRSFVSLVRTEPPRHRPRSGRASTLLTRTNDE